MKKVKIKESDLVNLISKIVAETVTQKKKQWIAEQKVKTDAIIESKMDEFRKLLK